jgi:hypothetical protein
VELIATYLNKRMNCHASLGRLEDLGSDSGIIATASPPVPPLSPTVKPWLKMVQLASGLNIGELARAVSAFMGNAYHFGILNPPK